MLAEHGTMSQGTLLKYHVCVCVCVHAHVLACKHVCACISICVCVNFGNNLSFSMEQRQLNVFLCFPKEVICKVTLER